MTLDDVYSTTSDQGTNMLKTGKLICEAQKNITIFDALNENIETNRLRQEFEDFAYADNESDETEENQSLHDSDEER